MLFSSSSSWGQNKSEKGHNELIDGENHMAVEFLQQASHYKKAAHEQELAANHVLPESINPFKKQLSRHVLDEIQVD